MGSCGSRNVLSPFKHKFSTQGTSDHLHLAVSYVSSGKTGKAWEEKAPLDHSGLLLPQTPGYPKALRGRVGEVELGTRPFPCPAQLWVCGQQGQTSGTRETEARNLKGSPLPLPMPGGTGTPVFQSEKSLE